MIAINGEGEEKVFVIHESRNDHLALIDFLDWLKEKNHAMVGFNNLDFDYPVIDYIWNAKHVTGESIYAKAQSIINAKDGEREYVRSRTRQLDLYRMNHYNNKNRRTSLKALQVSMNYPNVVDNPVDHTQPIYDQESIDLVLEYNRNDVLSTQHFLSLCEDKIELRKHMSREYKLDFINSSDVSMGEEIFLKELSEAMGVSPRDIKNIRKRGGNVPLSKVILPIEFETKEFQWLKHKLMETTVGEVDMEKFISDKVKGMSSTDMLSTIESYDMAVRRQAVSSKKKSFGYRAKYKDVVFEYGIGGVHACIASGVYKSTDEEMILDIDVRSFYPNISIKWELSPRHLPKKAFVKTYDGIFVKRAAAKDAGDMIKSDGLKLSLNGVFGKSLDKFSPFYDPYFFCGITINGQLFITKLAEMLMMKLPVTVLQVNTDGITIKFDRKLYDQVIEICEQWEEISRFELEYKEYSMMAIANVNNYFAVDTKGKIKEKSIFETKKELHKDSSFLVIPKAAIAHLTEGVPVMDFLKNHDQIYDFSGRYKATPGWKAWYVYLGEDEHGNPKQMKDCYHKMFRYIPVIKGGTGIKVHSDGRVINLLDGYLVTPFCKYREIDKNEIDYSYFYNEVVKLIESVKSPQLSLL